MILCFPRKSGRPPYIYFNIETLIGTIQDKKRKYYHPSISKLLLSVLLSAVQVASVVSRISILASVIVIDSAAHLNSCARISFPRGNKIVCRPESPDA